MGKTFNATKTFSFYPTKQCWLRESEIPVDTNSGEVKAVVPKPPIESVVYELP